MKLNRPDFEFFVEDDEPWDDYLARLASDKEWGGNLELKALSDVLRVTFVIHQLEAPCLVMQCSGSATRSLHLAYSGMMHYDSMRHASDTAPPGKPSTPFELGGGFVAARGGVGGGGGGGGGEAQPPPISAVERRVMEETGCPSLEYVVVVACPDTQTLNQSSPNTGAWLVGNVLAYEVCMRARAS
jgi:hypothetical protein